MKKYSSLIKLSFICFGYCLCVHAQRDSKDLDHSIGFSVGTTFGGPTSKFSKFLEQEGFDTTSSGFIFGPISYPVKTGPRGSFSLNYLWKQKNGNYLGFNLNLNQLGEVAGLNSSGRRAEVGFKSYFIGANYTFGPRLTKLSIGPALLFNNSYSIEFGNFEESKEKINNKIALGLKVGALIYLWNKSVTYSNIGLSYLISHPIKQGPFPLNGDMDGRDELEETKLNYGHGSFFFSFGIKL